MQFKTSVIITSPLEVKVSKTKENSPVHYKGLCSPSVGYSHKSTNYEPHCEITCFCIGKNKGTDQLSGNPAADQCLCFRYIDSTIPLLPKFQASSHLLWFLSSVYVRSGRNLKTGFLMTRLRCTKNEASEKASAETGKHLNAT